MIKRSPRQPTIHSAIKKLLDEQTNVILSAVDEKLTVTETRILSDVEEKLAQSEARVNAKIEKLTTTLDKFLKRLTDAEDEFEMMKLDPQSNQKSSQRKIGSEFELGYNTDL